jgi:hypothetical protein
MKLLALLFCFTACLPSSKYGNLANKTGVKNDVEISAPVESDVVSGIVADIPNPEIAGSSSSGSGTNTSTSDSSPIIGNENACVIDIPSCPTVGHSRFVLDTYEDSANSPDRCLRRAAEFKTACKTSDEVVAKSYLGGVLVGSATTSPSVADGNACVIDVPSCPAVAGYPRFIFDTYDNAGNNPERCLRRASEFKTACKTPHEVVAKSYLNYAFVGSATTSPSAGAGNACVIDVPSCPAVAGYPRFIFDTYEDATNNPDRCLRRAAEFKAACKTSDAVVAKSYLNYAFVGSATTSPIVDAGNACVIDVPSCPAIAGYPRFILDTYDGAGNNPERCLRRASEFKTACKTPHEVVAKSYLGWVLAGAASTNPYIGAGNACIIELPSCPSVGPRERFIFDIYENSPNDPGRCLQRAAEYKIACQSPDPVKATSYVSFSMRGAKTAFNRTSYDSAGFNEMFVMSHLMSLGQGFSSVCNEASQCPLNMGPIPVAKIDQILERLRRSGRIESIRDILPLIVVAPDPNYFPFDAEIASVLKVYQKNNFELLLSFGSPVPPWITERARARGWQDTRAAEMDEMANAIAYFITRMKEQQGVDAHWLSTKVVVEPFNEVNSFEGNPYYVRLLDNLVREKLRAFGMGVRETVPSSIITGNSVQHLDWFNRYYAAGGSGPANAHFYAEDAFDYGNYSNSLQRFESNVEALRGISPGGRVIVGEIGFPSAGVGKHNSQQTHDELLNRILNSPTLQKSERIYFWRLMSNWLNIRCNDHNCSPIVARETTFGYMDFHSLKPEDVLSYFFLPFGF